MVKGKFHKFDKKHVFSNIQAVDIFIKKQKYKQERLHFMQIGLQSIRRLA